MGAAVYLTRVTPPRGEALTMGYTPISNQRDSYWTTLGAPAALARTGTAHDRGFFPASAMKTDGKVPTCILSQQYERADDLDINAYFVPLRVLRYGRHRL